ncbi:MAG TPA: single-stranded DNA-binding protein [Allosphingosinicella sp.]|jgi:single-strand DNA-binding protein|nr:single-stranded DNA-binding protein [Allosphingosinicella sp.]
MAGSVNKVILVGNLGRDPEARSFANGGKVVKFSVATSETWNDRSSGDRKEKTEWHNVVIYDDKIAEVAERYLKKGSKVYVEGQMQYREYDDANGQKQKIAEVVIQRFRGALTMLEGRNAGGGDSDFGGGGGRSDSYGGGRSGGGDFGGGGQRSGGGGRSSPAFDSDLDDDVPF